MLLINHQEFISNLTTKQYILCSEDGKFSLTHEKPHSFKIKDIVKISFECLSHFQKSEAGSLHERCKSLKELEHGLNFCSSRIIQSIEKRWWYAILHFFGYKAQAPEGMTRCLSDLATVIQKLELELEKKTQQNELRRKLAREALTQINATTPFTNIRSVPEKSDIKQKDLKNSESEEKKALECKQLNNFFQLNGLPKDLKWIIYSYLSIPKLNHLRLVSKNFKTSIDEFFDWSPMRLRVMEYLSSNATPLNPNQQIKYEDLLILNINNPSKQFAQHIHKELVSFFSKTKLEKAIDWTQTSSKTFSTIINFLLKHLNPTEIEQIINGLLSYRTAFTVMNVELNRIYSEFNYPKLVLLLFENFSTAQQPLISFLTQEDATRPVICQLILKFLSDAENFSDVSRFNMIYALHHPKLLNVWETIIKDFYIWNEMNMSFITAHICCLLDHSLTSEDQKEQKAEEIEKKIHNVLRVLKSSFDKRAEEFLRFLQSLPICTTWNDQQIRTLIRAIMRPYSGLTTPSYDFYIREFIQGELIHSSLKEKFLDFTIEEIILYFPNNLGLGYSGYSLTTLLPQLQDPKTIKIFIQAVKKYLEEPFQSIALLTLAKWTGRSYQEVCDPEKIPPEIAPSAYNFDMFNVDENRRLINTFVRWCHNFLLPLSQISKEDLHEIMENLSIAHQTKLRIIANGLLLPSNILIKTPLDEDAMVEIFQSMALNYEYYKMEEPYSLLTLMEQAQPFGHHTEKFFFSENDSSFIE